MNAGGELYSAGATFHPDERPLPLPYATQQAQQLRAALADFNGFYSSHRDYAVVNPVHNLLALLAGVVVAVVVLVWLIRRLRRQLKARRAVAAG
jgi:hypothetical protein